MTEPTIETIKELHKTAYGACTIWATYIKDDDYAYSKIERVMKYLNNEEINAEDRIIMIKGIFDVENQYKLDAILNHELL